MVSYINPNIVVQDNPRGLDIAIVKCQMALSNLSWIDKVYGRAFVQHKPNASMHDAKTKTQLKENTLYNKIMNGKDYIFPEVLGINGEPEDISPNDNLKAYCFFISRDPGKNMNPSLMGDRNYNIRQPISIIFWANLLKINPNHKYRFGEVLKSSILSKLVQMPALETDNFFESYNEVFKEFTVNNDWFRAPFWAFRIDAFLSYRALPQCAVDDFYDQFSIEGNPNTFIMDNKNKDVLADFLPYRILLTVGTDTDTGAIITPDPAKLKRVPTDAAPKLTDLDFLSDISLGSGGNIQYVPIVNNGTAFDFTDSVGELEDGIITFTVKKKI